MMENHAKESQDDREEEVCDWKHSDQLKDGLTRQDFLLTECLDCLA